MRVKIVVLLAVMALALILLAGCAGERGLKGDAGTAECILCHSDNTLIVAIDGQWRNSVHATGGNFDRNTPPCSGCHTSEGFVAKLETGDPGTPENPSAIGCFTCHEPHTNHDFNLRTMDPVALEMGGTFDMGEGNLCANCHQARMPNPPLPGSGTITITSSRWGPHHGPQANVLSGMNAYVFPGESYRNSRHTAVVTNGCPMCHMATPSPFSDLAGGHAWNMTYGSEGSEEELTTGCNIPECHNGDLPNFNYLGGQDSVEVLLGILRQGLIDDSLLTENDLVNAPSGSPLTIDVDVAGAIFNFLFFEADRSLGVHNTNYAIDALNASIEHLP